MGLRRSAAGSLVCSLLLASPAQAQPTPYDDPLPPVEPPPAPEVEPEAQPEPPPGPEQPPAKPDAPPPPKDAPPPEAGQDGDGGIMRDAPFEPPPAPPPPPVDPRLEEAKELHKQGLKLLQAGDTERALSFFQRSRATFESAPNITNVALCLQRLGRYDEALETYEVLLTKYADKLDPEDRAAIGPTIKELLDKVASIRVSANVPGTVVIDGRERGTLPLAQPIRVLAGLRSVRIFHPGHEPYETTIEPKVQQTLTIDAKLKPLMNAGILRTEAPPGIEAIVLIDGAPAGKAPFEGPLAPGKHVVQLVAGEEGSALTEVIVNAGQIAMARPQLGVLGPEVQIRTQPRTATLEIDGIAVGAGVWTGRLTAGAHTISAREAGYHPLKRAFESRPGDPVAAVDLALPLDKNHPRWPKPAEKGSFWVDAYAGYAGAPTLAGDASAGCPDACDGSVAAHGGMFGLRAGYRFPIGLSLELGGGYTLLSSSFGRDIPSTFGETDQYAVTYRIDDRLFARGPFVSPSVSYRHGLNDWLSLEGRAALGVWFAAVSDDYDASASAGATRSEVTVANREIARTVTIFVAPEIAAVAKLGPVDLRLAFAVPIFPLEGPTLVNGPLGPSGAPDASDPGAASNAPVSSPTDGERAWDTFVLFSPQIAAGYAF